MATPVRRSPRHKGREASPSPSPEPAAAEADVPKAAPKEKSTPKKTTGTKKGAKGGKGKGKSKIAAKSATKGLKRKKTRVRSYGSYIYSVLKQEMPDNSISRRAMGVLNSFVNDLFERLAQESIRMAKVAKRQTISSREVQSAVGVVFPGELAKASKTEIAKAVTKYTSSEGGTKPKKTPRKKRATKKAAE